MVSQSRVALAIFVAPLFVIACSGAADGPISRDGGSRCAPSKCDGGTDAGAGRDGGEGETGDDFDEDAGVTVGGRKDAGAAVDGGAHDAGVADGGIDDDAGCDDDCDAGVSGTSGDDGNGNGNGDNGGGDDAGAAHKRVFVTSTYWYTTGRIIGDGSGADAVCQNAAFSADLGGTWRAWISDPYQGATSRIADASPWYKMDGELIFPSMGYLASGTPLTNVQFDEHLGTAGRYWTGSDGYGQASTNGTCSDWTSSLPTDQAETGDPMGFGSAFSAAGTSTCDQALALLCIEQ